MQWISSKVSTFVLPYFTWLFSIFPLFTENQRKDLNHLYLTLLKRVRRSQCWSDIMFSALYHEKSLDDRCFSYWAKYLRKTISQKDGFLLMEQLEVNNHRSKWLEESWRIRCLRRSKRFVLHTDVLSKTLHWMVQDGSFCSTIEKLEHELQTFLLYLESF